MKIEAVIVCVNYADFLAWTLPTNKQLFDKIVVITSNEDIRTQKLCEFWHVECIKTDKFYEDGHTFNKGKGINVGLDKIDGDSWVVHMDADIFLPPLFRNILQDLELDELGLYHIDRMMCDNFQDWIKYYCLPDIQQENNIYVHIRPFPIGVRLNKKEYGGWTPIGFFQMWNQGKMNLAYPEHHTDAGRSDLLFTIDNFPRNHRHMLAEIIGIHLETKLNKNEKMGANWGGRKTPIFGPIIEKLAVDKQQDMVYDIKNEEK